MRRHFDVNNRSRLRISVRSPKFTAFLDESIESIASRIDEGVGESSETYDEYRM